MLWSGSVTEMLYILLCTDEVNTAHLCVAIGSANARGLPSELSSGLIIPVLASSKCSSSVPPDLFLPVLLFCLLVFLPSALPLTAFASLLKTP